MNLRASPAKPLKSPLERWIRLHGAGAVAPAYLGVTTTDRALRSRRCTRLARTQ